MTATGNKDTAILEHLVESCTWYILNVYLCHQETTGYQRTLSDGGDSFSYTLDTLQDWPTLNRGLASRYLEPRRGHTF